MMEGRGQQLEGWQTLGAWVSANLMNCWRSEDSDPVTVKALLGHDDDEPEPVPITSAAQLQELAKQNRLRMRMEDI